MCGPKYHRSKAWSRPKATQNALSSVVVAPPPKKDMSQHIKLVFCIRSSNVEFVLHDFCFFFGAAAADVVNVVDGLRLLRTLVDGGLGGGERVALLLF